MPGQKYVNKVTYYGNTLIDLTQDGISADDVLNNNKKFHLSDGTQINSGNIPVRESSDIVVTDVIAHTVQAGYYPESFTYQVDNTVDSTKIQAGETILGVTGTYTDDADATAGQILYEKTAYVNGNKLEGSMPNIGTYTGAISNASNPVNIPAGYHNGYGSVGIASAEQQKLLSTNIRSGVTLLGVTGSNLVVNTSLGASFAASSADIISGKSAFVNGNKIDGSMTNNGSFGSKYISLLNDSISVVAGYYSGAGSVSISSTEKAKIISKNIKFGISILGVSGDSNVIDTDSANLTAGNSAITASSILSAYSGYVDGAEVIGGMVNKGSSGYTVTNTSPVTIQEGYYNGNGQIQISDANLIASNIKYNTEILGITGTFTAESSQPISANTVLDGYIGYVNGQKIIGTYNPSSSIQVSRDITINELIEAVSGPKTIDPEEGKSAMAAAIIPQIKASTDAGVSYTETLASGMIKSGITILGIPGDSNVVDTAVISIQESPITSSQVLSSYAGYVNGNKITGSMPNNGLIVGSLLTKNQAVTVPSGYTSGGMVQIALAEQNKIIASNIKSGVDILGVTGTYTSTSNAPTSSQILSGKEAFANSNKITGSMPDQTGTSIYISDRVSGATIPRGYHDGNGKAYISSNYIGNLSADNIRQNATILGVTGNLKGPDFFADEMLTQSVQAKTLYINMYSDAWHSNSAPTFPVDSTPLVLIEGNIVGDTSYYEYDRWQFEICKATSVDYDYFIQCRILSTSSLTENTSSQLAVIMIDSVSGDLNYHWNQSSISIDDFSDIGANASFGRATANYSIYANILSTAEASFGSFIPETANLISSNIRSGVVIGNPLINAITGSMAGPPAWINGSGVDWQTFYLNTEIDWETILPLLSYIELEENISIAFLNPDGSSELQALALFGLRINDVYMLAGIAVTEGEEDANIQVYYSTDDIEFEFESFSISARQGWNNYSNTFPSSLPISLPQIITYTGGILEGAKIFARDSIAFGNYKRTPTTETVTITENGTYDVIDKATAIVNVSTGGGESSSRDPEIIDNVIVFGDNTAVNNRILILDWDNATSYVDSSSLHYLAFPDASYLSLPELYEIMKNAWRTVTIGDWTIEAIATDGGIAGGIGGYLNRIDLLVYHWYPTSVSGYDSGNTWTNVTTKSGLVDILQAEIDNIDEIYEHYWNNFSQPLAHPVSQRIFNSLVKECNLIGKKPPEIPFINVTEGVVSDSSTEWRGGTAGQNNTLWGLIETDEPLFQKLCIHIPYDFGDGQGEQVCRLRFVIHRAGTEVTIYDKFSGDSHTVEVFDVVEGDTIDPFRNPPQYDHRYKSLPGTPWVDIMNKFWMEKASWDGYISDGKQ